jgi:membrane protein DedA with SNARE-associated domain/membrane-associated phospholipid phosphatase
MEHIQPYLDYFAAHPAWALAVIFLISFGEALLVIGLVVPSTAVLVGAGALVGTGKLHFWPVMLATTAGCILGDQVSFWAGRIFGDRLRNLWPLSAYPHLVAKGEDFVKRHGGKSIALGRFVPGVKAVVPGIVGMFGMGQIQFLSINIVSGIVWSFGHLLPGVLVGQALSLAGELSGRLLVILLVLFTVLAVVGWLVRLIAASVMPYRNAIQGKMAVWARAQGSKPMRRFAKAISPKNPRSVLLFLAILLTPFFAVMLIDIASGKYLEHAVGNIDFSIFNLFSSMRNAPGDELLVPITMLGDDIVLFATIAGAAVWLLANRAWRTAATLVATTIGAKIAILAINALIGTHSLMDQTSNAALHLPTFPSNHTLMAAVVFGSLALLVNRGMGRWAGALVTSTCSIIVIAIAFSRLYLGVNWMSDVIGAILLAVVIITCFSVANATWPSRRVRPLGILLSSLVAFFIATTFNVAVNYDGNEDTYAQVDSHIILTLANWEKTGWQQNQSMRVDIAGKPEETFAVHWIGTLETLEAALQNAGFQPTPKWTWRDALPYLDPHAPLHSLAPRPALNQGLKAKFTAIQPIANQQRSRLVVRVFESNAIIEDMANSPVYYVSLTLDVLRPRFNLLSVPSVQPATADEVQTFQTNLETLPNVEIRAANNMNNQRIDILSAKP